MSSKNPKNTTELFDSINKQISDFMGDQEHSFVLVVHQCGDDRCEMNLTSNLEKQGVVAMAIEILQEHSKDVDGLEIKAFPMMGPGDGGQKIH